jgi:hypothetical protein
MLSFIDFGLNLCFLIGYDEKFTSRLGLDLQLQGKEQTALFCLKKTKAPVTVRSERGRV